MSHAKKGGGWLFQFHVSGALTPSLDRYLFDISFGIVASNKSLAYKITKNSIGF